MAEQSSRIGRRTVLARFQREGPRKRRPNEPRWITEEIILLEFAKPCGIHVSFPATVAQTFVHDHTALSCSWANVTAATWPKSRLSVEVNGPGFRLRGLRRESATICL